MPDLWTVLEWTVWAIYQYALLLIPLLQPDSVPDSVPSTWYYYNTYWDWFGHIDGDRRPDSHWLRRWFWMCLKCAEFAITSGFRTLITQAVGNLQTIIGSVRAGFPNFGSWVTFLHNVTGGRVPTWTGNLAAGLDWLRARLPAGIRELWQSWDELFESIRASVRSWVRSSYDALVALGSRAWDWATNQGERLRRWIDDARGWLDQLRSDPYGVISGVLGSSWAWLVGFSLSGRDIVLGWLGPDIRALLSFGRDCVRWYYNLWSSGQPLLSSLISNAGEFVLDKLSAELEKRW